MTAPQQPDRQEGCGTTEGGAPLVAEPNGTGGDAARTRTKPSVTTAGTRASIRRLSQTLNPPLLIL